MKKILFLHGFYASGDCVPAVALREGFKDRAVVLTPDLPLHPFEALDFVRLLCNKEKPNVLVGNSCGSFYAQIISSEKGLPALLGNPYFRMSEFLSTRIGRQQYKSPRKDGVQNFVIDRQLICEFANIEACQFDNSSFNKKQIWGLFGKKDTLAHFESLFLDYYTAVFHFPGAHTPTAEEVKTWYVPLVEKLLELAPELSIQTP